MSAHVVVRCIAGPATGTVRRLAGGDTWRVGDPPVVLLTSLGEGQVRVEPFRDGVRVGSRAIARAETLVVDAAPETLTLPDGATLWLTTSHAALPSAAAAPLVLDEAAPLPASASSKWRLRRPPLRLPRIPTAWRVSRAVGVSLAVHATLALLLFLLLLLAPRGDEGAGRTIRFRFGGEVGDGAREARSEVPAPEERVADAETESPIEREVDDLAAALDSGATGVSSAPAGALLAARRGGRERLLREGGGDAATEGALDLALGWLARHQSVDGTWDARGFDGLCRSGDRCAGEGERAYREATTALALLAYLGAGHTHEDGPWRETIRDGLAALVRLQREDGSFATDPKRAYASAIAALALAEAYGLTGAEPLREPARRAARYFVDRQSESGGWRYHPGDGKADTSVTGWVTMALVSARRARLDVPAHTLDGCRRWFAGRTAEDGLVGYMGRGRGTDALLGVGLFCRSLLGADATGPELAPVARRLAGRSPRWPAKLGATGYARTDPMHWYYGSLGAFQADGDAWLMWERPLRTMLLRNQARDGCAAGSWDAAGSTGVHGGRVAVTALCALCLEVTYRYPRATFGR